MHNEMKATQHPLFKFAIHEIISHIKFPPNSPGLCQFKGSIASIWDRKVNISNPHYQNGVAHSQDDL